MKSTYKSVHLSYFQYIIKNIIPSSPLRFYGFNEGYRTIH